MVLADDNPHLEAVFKIFVFFQESGVIYDDLGICDPQFQNFIVDRFRGVNGSYGLLKVHMKRPEFERLE